MTWWFIILGFGALMVVCVAIALVLRVRRHMSEVKPATADDGESIDSTRNDGV
jgi:hypothetical protein